ncbi:hypothetical protein ACERK3_03125 [Phycisphaerales bacterium AB-hyl4]|uniref:Uncharacterized protein n=1 Tax=Natronomicrosphaera hydrolytica TaxID=3242702 RepID=A0ABV4U348_9BACT
MATSFGALCTDFYVNQKLALKMDLPAERETVLHFFDRVRKSSPSMNRFRRYDGEFALESSRRDPQYRWMALRRTSLRTGHVNPDSMEQAYRFHREILELAPHFLTISPLDVDYLELLYGFDLECDGNHDQVIYEALYENTPMAEALKAPGVKMLDVQPIFGLSLSDRGDIQAYFEVKTRPKSRRGSSKPYRGEPISLFVTVRKYGPIDDLVDLQTAFDKLSEHVETLATERLVPHLLTPIARHITSGSA